MFRRSTKSQAFSQVGSFINATSPTQFVDSTVSNGAVYEYCVTAVDLVGNQTACGQQSRATATMFSFSDDPLAPNSTIASSHVTELRAAIGAARVFAELSPATWTDPSLAGFVVKATHLNELRDRLGEALAAIPRSALPYTDPVIDPGVTIIKSVHIEEIRRNVR